MSLDASEKVVPGTVSRTGITAASAGSARI